MRALGFGIAAVASLTLAPPAFAAKCPQPQGVRTVAEYSSAKASGIARTVTSGFEQTGPNTFSFTGTTHTEGTYEGKPEELDGTIVSGVLKCGQEEFVEEASGNIGGVPVSVTFTSHNEYTATELVNGSFVSNYGDIGTYHGEILPEPPEITQVTPTEGSGGGGTKVAIRGRRLKDASVWFGASAAPSVEVNGAGTMIATITPGGVSAPFGIPVVVDTPGGESVFHSFEYLPPAIKSVSPKTGAALGGTKVTIKGENLTNPRTVHFNLAEAWDVKANASGTAITALTPFETPGPAFVTMESAGGYNISFGLFTYVAPTITSVSPNSGPAAGGTEVTIEGTRFKGVSEPAGVVFGSTPATSYTVNKAGTSITAFSPPGALGPVDVRVTVPTLGTSQAVQADEFTYR
jgi:hypothetical protein